MVIFFQPISRDYTIFMGVDKHENEELLRFAWPEDIWFHVDAHSSAHVYLRHNPREDGTPDPTWSVDDIPEDVMQDCCQLVKANSIEGNKLNNIAIVYTPLPNLKKTSDMAIGQVGFVRGRNVKKTHVERRLNVIVNRVNKTRSYVDLDTFRAQLDERTRAIRLAERKVKKDMAKKQAEEDVERMRVQAEKDAFEAVLNDNMTSNQEMDVTAEEYEDDFL